MKNSRQRTVKQLLQILKQLLLTIRPFLYFLDRNQILYDENDQKLLDDHTLVALTIMIAESKPDEKEMMVSVIMNCLAA